MNFSFKKLNDKHNQKGFTLVELLVAASILLSAVGAPMYVGVQGIIIATEAENKIAATFLAEEGIELIRNQRDTNLLNDIPLDTSVRWDDEFGSNSNCLVSSGGGGSDRGCVVGRQLDDFSSSNIYIAKCTGTDGCDPLQVSALGELRLYGYGVSGTYPDSIFTRTIRVERVTASEVKVISEVQWTSRGTTKEVEVAEHLFDYGFN